MEALVEWIISKNIKSHKNIATYFIKKVQESESELDVINQAVKKYNQSLVYCEQDGEDLAAIQLQKVVAAHPSFLKAYQLLALIYMKTEQYAKARQAIRKAHKLDTTNEITLKYMHELKKLHGDKVNKLKGEKDRNAISYKLGNETIIQPVAPTLKDHTVLMTILNLVLGVAVGVAVMGFLVMPNQKKSINAKNNKEIIAFSEQIASKKSELDAITKDLQAYEAQSAETENEKQIAQSTKESYETLVPAIEHFYTEKYDVDALIDELLAINGQSLGEQGKASYDKMIAAIFPAQCETLYKEAEKHYEVANYKSAAPKLERVMQMDAGYADGQAILLLLKTYHAQEETTKADEIYERIKTTYPDSEILSQADALMAGTDAAAPE